MDGARAETAAVYLLDRPGRALAPVAAYRVPKHTLSVLTSALLPVDEQGFRDSVFNRAAVTSSSDVQNDPQFSFELFHRFPHRSGVIVPVHVDGIVAGAFYLVWWERAQELDPAQVATLEAVGQQVALPLRGAGFYGKPSASGPRPGRRGALPQPRPQRAGRDLSQLGGRPHRRGQPRAAGNAALPSREALLATNAATLYVDPGDRERVQRLMEAGGRVQDFALEMRTGDGGTVWVRINSRSVRESDTDYYEGILEDITHQRRAEEAQSPGRDHRPPRAPAPTSGDPRAAGSIRPGPRRGQAHRRDHRPHGADHSARDSARHRGLTDARSPPIGHRARPCLVAKKVARRPFAGVRKP